MKLFYENPVSTCVDNLTAIITYDITDDYGRKRYDQEMEFTGNQSELRHRLKELRLMGAYNIEVDTEPCFYESKSKPCERLKEKVEDFEDTKDIVLIKSWLEDNGFDYEYIKSNQSASWFNINGQKRRIPRLNPKKNKVYSYMDNIRSLIESKSRLKEQDVEIEVKHEGILEVPDGKNVDDLPISHFEKLAKKKGLGKITKALNNLQVWNKNDDPKLSKWAGNMIDKLNKKFDKKESLLRLNEKDNFNGSITSAADYYYPRWKSEVMDSSQIRDELVRKFGHSEDFADEVLELIFDKYDDDQKYWDEYDESLLRKRKIQKVKNGNKSKTFNESLFDYLDERTWSIVDELERRGYRSGKPIRFGGKLLVDYTKVYDTDKRTMSGVEITIDPLEGDVKVQEFSEGIDTEDLTDLCPVDFVETSTDVQKIDNWAKRIKKHSYV